MTRFSGLPAVLPALLLSLVACSSSEEPPTDEMTLLVTNDSCQLMNCSPIRVLAFPDKQPGTPGGNWSIDLGLVTTPSACLTLPPGAIFRVIGGPDTTTFSWTTGDAVSLGTIPASGSIVLAVPSTGSFVPDRAKGWKVSLPGGGEVTEAEACSP
jgi:hypothetical protein